MKYSLTFGILLKDEAVVNEYAPISLKKIQSPVVSSGNLTFSIIKSSESQVGPHIVLLCSSSSLS